MRPIVRPAGNAADVPEGCAVEAIGIWKGRESEVAYDPRRYDVLLSRQGAMDDLEDRFVAMGWECQGAYGSTSFWVRDRVAATRAALESRPEPPGREIGGLA